MVTPQTAHRELIDAWNQRTFDVGRDLLHPQYSYAGGEARQQTSRGRKKAKSKRRSRAARG